MQARGCGSGAGLSVLVLRRKKTLKNPGHIWDSTSVPVTRSVRRPTSDASCLIQVQCGVNAGLSGTQQTDDTGNSDCFVEWWGVWGDSGRGQIPLSFKTWYRTWGVSPISADNVGSLLRPPCPPEARWAEMTCYIYKCWRDLQVGGSKWTAWIQLPHMWPR